MPNYLFIDFGSTNTKLTAVDTDKCEIIGTSKSFTTVDSDIRVGYNKALKELKEKIGEVEFTKTIACSSAAGGLKMCAIGLVEELTVEAAKRACFGAGGKVDLVFSHFITKSEVQMIIDRKIDIILLAGGIDGGNSECVLFNAKMLGEANIKIPVVYAGNKSCQDEIKEIFDKYQINGYICDNVMPKLNMLNTDSAKEVIRKIFLTNIIEAKGIKKVEDEVDGVVLPTPYAVLKASELLSKGYLDELGLDDIVLFDIGGATTDVYSMSNGNPRRVDVVLRGLEEPYAKRTVEGDLGMRYSAIGVASSLTKQEVARYLEKGIDIIKEAELRNKNVEMIAKTEAEEQIDREFGKICVNNAFQRHVGKMETVYSPMGTLFYQTGKDLTGVKYIIGTGGIVINDKKPTEILKAACYDPSMPLELRPKNPTYLLDKSYILSSMGLLSDIDPLASLKIMKKYLVEIEE